MSLKYTTLKKDENVLKYYKDNSGMLTRGLGTVSSTHGVAYFIGEVMYHGSLYITNQRLIFESKNGDLIKDFDFKKIDRVVTYKRPSMLDRINIIFNDGEPPDNKIIMYCVDEVCDYLDIEFFTDEARSKRIVNNAKERVKLLDYSGAIQIYEKNDMLEEAAKVRRMMYDEKKVNQKIVHGDEVTKTEIKDSVLNRSNIGGGSSKMQELEKLTEMKKEGLIDDDEFKQMKKEILGK